MKPQLTLMKLRSAIHLAATIPCCYAMLNIRGIDAGFPKNPLESLTEDEIKKVKTALEKTGYL